MRRMLVTGAFALALAACGGAPERSAPPEDEVGAEWTAGDDAPLEDAAE